MARLLKDTCVLAAEILDGKHDSDLDFVLQAVAARRKSMFRKGVRVRMVGTRNPEVDGMEGIVLKVNTKTVSVGCGARHEFGYDREFNVPPTMLEVIA